MNGQCSGGTQKLCGVSGDSCCPRENCSLLRDADCPGLSYTQTSIAQPTLTPGPAGSGDANPPAAGGAGTETGGRGALDLFLGDGGSESIAILEGDGRGGFELGGLFSAVGARANQGGAGVVAAFRVGSLALGDVNGDGNLDIVAALASPLPNSDQLATLLGDGALHYDAGPHRTLAGHAIRVEIGELTADGRLDALLATQAGLEVLQGKGDGRFDRLALLDAGKTTTDVAIGRTEAGRLEVIAAFPDEGLVKIYERHGDLISESAALEVEQPVVLAVGDLTGDGIEDLAVGSEQGFIEIHPGIAAGGFEPALAERVDGVNATQLERADLNADSLADLAALEGETGAVKLMLGRGNGTFDLLEGPAASGPAAGLVVADFNGDRIPDLIVSGPQVSIGLGSVTTPPIVAGDATGEGDIDEADLPRLIEELYDGDGTDAMSCGGGAVFSAPGADANVDGRIDAADLIGAIRSR